MLEDSPLKLLQLPPRLQAELVDESIACSPENVEGVGLASGPVQGEHQVAAQALPERLLCHEPLELGHELGAPTAHEFRLDARLHCPKPKLVKPPRLNAGQRLVEQVDPRRPTPQRERLAQRRPSSGVIARLGCPIGGPDQLLEPIDVELARLDREQVAAGLAEQPARAELLSQPVDVGIERFGDAWRRVLSPQRLDQFTSRNDLVCVQQQHRQQRPLLAPSN